jgi:hypothetical protein
MIVTPLAIFAWHYFLGWLIDRYRKRKRARQTQRDLLPQK